MAARLKLPPYGKRLLMERRAGRHPLAITLVYGDQWWDIEHPKICVTPAEYAPGRYDWRMVAGLKVTVLDQDLGALDNRLDLYPPAFGKFFDLLQELAAAQAYVELTWPAATALPSVSLSMLALEHKYRDRDTRKLVWPRWWSDALDESDNTRYALHLQDVSRRRFSIEERGRAA